MRFLKSYGIAFLIIVVIAGWMLSGTLIEGGQGPGQGEQPFINVVGGEDSPLHGVLVAIGLIEEEPEEPELIATAQVEAEAEEALPSVRAKVFEAEPLPQIVQLRGQTQADSVVAVRAETSGTVQEVTVRKGDTVEAGALLCTLDQGTRQARLATAEAQLAQAQSDLDNNAQLRERGVVPANTSRQYEVALLSAQAAFDDAQAELDRTEIYAEVGGLVQAPLATVGDSLSAGSECATIVQLDPIIFIGEVPEARVGNISVGQDALVSAVTGEEVQGKVSFVAATATAATRTFGIEIEIPNGDRAIRDGVTAEALIQVGTIEAHLVPQSVLTLDADGVLGIRTVDDDLVAFHPVEIVRDTREGSWVTGLPETASVITLGQEYVQAGQRVDVDFGEDTAQSDDSEQPDGEV